MYFWNIQKLKQDLKENKVTESDKFKYFFVYMVGLMLPWFRGNEIPDLAQRIYVYALYFVSIIFIFLLYKLNGGAKGKRFIEKYISLSWVLGIRVFVQLIVPLMLFFIILSIYFKDVINTYYLVSFIPTVIYYYLLTKSLLEINKNT